MRAIAPSHPGDAWLVEYKQAIASSLIKNDIDQHDLAEVCLVDPSMVSRWLSKRCRDALSAEHIKLLEPRFPALHEDIVAWLAGASIAIARRRETPITERACVVDVLRDFTATTGAFTQELLARVSSTHVRDDVSRGLDALDASLRDVERTIAEARQLVDDAKASQAEIYDLARARVARSS